MNKPIVGCVQLNSQQNVDANLALIETMIKQAKTQGVHILVLPENACRMGNQHELSERFDELSAWYANLAFKHSLFIIAGTLPCPFRPDGTPVPHGRLRQVSQLFAPDGSCLARYDKIHLFQATVSDKKGSYDEARTFEPGDKTVVAECDVSSLIDDFTYHYTKSKGIISIGMMVCFDLRFPAFAQRLRQAGADILTAPSAFTYKTGEAHWQLLLQARALDAQCLVVGAAQGGEHIYKNGINRSTWGHSAITNANGDITAESTPAVFDETTSGHNELITAAFNQQAQHSWRQNMPIYHCHRLS